VIRHKQQTAAAAPRVHSHCKNKIIILIKEIERESQKGDDEEEHEIQIHFTARL
jgi:hypothetical protein